MSEHIEANIQAFRTSYRALEGGRGNILCVKRDKVPEIWQTSYMFKRALVVYASWSLYVEFPGFPVNTS